MTDRLNEVPRSLDVGVGNLPALYIAYALDPSMGVLGKAIADQLRSGGGEEEKNDNPPKPPTGRKVRIGGIAGGLALGNA